jgi:hypothetical protein
MELSKGQLDQMLEEVAGYTVSLEEDPTLSHLGTKYLQQRLAQCRNYTNRVQHYLQMAMRAERTLLTEIKQAKLDFDFKVKTALADDPLVRQQRALDDRKALAESLLKTESDNIRALEIRLIDVQESVKLLKFKYGDLQRTSGDIKMQRRMVHDDKMAQMGGDEGYNQPQTNQDRSVPDGMPAPVPAEPLGPSDILDPSKRPDDLPEPIDEAHAGQIAEFLRRHPEKKNEPLDAPVKNGLLCSVCKGPQFEVNGGVSCVNGHGGAEGLPPPPEPAINAGASVDYSDLLT